MQNNDKESQGNSYNPYVMKTLHDDGSADFTISIDGEDHKFSASINSSNATLTYEETLTFRGKISVSEPRNEVFKLLMQSDEMTEFLESEGLSGVRRNR